MLRARRLCRERDCRPGPPSGAPRGAFVPGVAEMRARPPARLPAKTLSALGLRAHALSAVPGTGLEVPGARRQRRFGPTGLSKEE